LKVFAIRFFGALQRRNKWENRDADEKSAVRKDTPSGKYVIKRADKGTEILKLKVQNCGIYNSFPFSVAVRLLLRRMKVFNFRL